MIRSFLFAPANRLDLIAKLPRFGADCLVIDLEDATPPADKERARASLAQAISTLRRAGTRGRLSIRVNPPGSSLFRPDLEAAIEAGADSVVVPKIERREDLVAALGLLDAGVSSGRGSGMTLIGGVESMQGVLAVEELVAIDPRMDSIFFGAEDYISDIGGRRTVSGHEVLHARSRVVLAGRARGLNVIDQAVLEIRDDQRFIDCANVGRDLGYTGKICVHPAQVALANRIFSPSAEETERARRLIAAYERAVLEGRGTIDFEGVMVDGPLLKRARDTLARAEAIAALEGARS